MPGSPQVSCTLVLACFRLSADGLAVFAPGGLLPRRTHSGGNTQEAARDLIDTTTRSRWFEVAGPVSRAHGSLLTLAIAAASPRATEAADADWTPLARIARLSDADRAVVRHAQTFIRWRSYFAPVAFALAGDPFTLSDLQDAYERLLGRPVHKAGFRRALAAAALTRPVKTWRQDGRGRPAQLYRYSKPKGRTNRPLRFDLIGTDQQRA